MLEEGAYQRVALESPSQSPTQSSEHLLDNKCVQSSASSSSDNIDDTFDVTNPKDTQPKTKVGHCSLINGSRVTSMFIAGEITVLDKNSFPNVI